MSVFFFFLLVLLHQLLPLHNSLNKSDIGLGSGSVIALFFFRINLKVMLVDNIIILHSKKVSIVAKTRVEYDAINTLIISYDVPKDLKSKRYPILLIRII